MLGSGQGARVIAIGYAGAPACINDPHEDHIRQCGPLPKGRYLVAERFHSRFASPAFELYPCVGTELHGRSGFWIHGDNRAGNRSASSGCIVLDRTARLEIKKCIAAARGRGAFVEVLP